MRILRRTGLSGLLGVLVLLPQGAARPQEKSGAAVDLKVVPYEGLAQAILNNRGKVIVVDFWANTCAPCKEAMPHLVELYNQRHKDGLTAITVAVDKAWDNYSPAVHRSLLKALKKNGAAFTNLVLDVSKEFLEEKLRVSAVPCLYVFDRQGRWTRFSDEKQLRKDAQGRYAEVEALVGKLLAEK
jgi:thiol-disulfide isomerase/thioredoxin